MKCDFFRLFLLIFRLKAQIHSTFVRTLIGFAQYLSLIEMNENRTTTTAPNVENIQIFGVFASVINDVITAEHQLNGVTYR